MLAKEIQNHAAALAGTTSPRHKLVRDFMLDYIEWGCQEVLERLSRLGKDYPFLYATTTLDTAVVGTSGDYEMPRDFASPFDVSSTGSSGSTMEFDGVPMTVLLPLSRSNLARPSYGVYWHEASQRWRMRFYTPAGTPTVASYTIGYRRQQARLQSPNDPLVFPSGQGWEPVVVQATLKWAYGFMQEDLAHKQQLKADFEEALEGRIASANAVVPDAQAHVPWSPKHLFDKAMEGEPY